MYLMLFYSCAIFFLLLGLFSLFLMTLSSFSCVSHDFVAIFLRFKWFSDIFVISLTTLSFVSNETLSFFTKLSDCSTISFISNTYSSLFLYFSPIFIRSLTIFCCYELKRLIPAARKVSKTNKILCSVWKFTLLRVEWTENYHKCRATAAK